MKKKAIIFGSTGLVGGCCLRQLLDDDRYGSIVSFARRNAGLSHPKLTEQVIDFDRPDSWKKLVTGDEIYTCLGTTIKKAGSKDNQYRVDYTYQYEALKIAAGNGVKRMGIVSAAGADPSSRIFYSRIKGELDRDIQELPFLEITIIRPSILMGERREKRPAESAGIVLGKIATRIIPPLKKYRPIHGEIVARALINGVNRAGGARVLIARLEDVFALADGNHH